MKGLVLSLALATLYVLYVQADVPLQPDFQEDKFVGKWFDIGFASNSAWFKAKKQFLKQGTTLISPTADGNLDVVATYPEQDQCEKKSMTYIKTQEEGRFLSQSPWDGRNSVFSVVETNYDEYILTHILTTKGNEINTIVSLFGREKELRPDLTEHFKQTAKDFGLTDENIIILPQSDQCMTEA